jgi:NarL family two-component system response regulator LiaR
MEVNLTFGLRADLNTEERSRSLPRLYYLWGVSVKRANAERFFLEEAPTLIEALSPRQAVDTHICRWSQSTRNGILAAPGFFKRRMEQHCCAEALMDKASLLAESSGLSETRPIRVVLADDHALVREGTRRLLETEPDVQVVAEAASGTEAVAAVERDHPDVVIMDIAMPGGNGIEATRHIKQLSPQTAVLALTAYDDDQYVIALLEAGAAGFLLKNVHGRELVEAVRAVHRGEPILDTAVAARVLRRMAGGAPPGTLPEATLSEREMEVLREAARGLPNKEIARRMGLSVRTVHTHLGNIFGKLQVGSRTEAVLQALRRGWVRLDETEGER